MRLVLVNPHYYDYGKTLTRTLLGGKSFLKYNYFIKNYLNNKDKKTVLYIDGSKTSLGTINFSFPIFPKFFVFFELMVWMLINRVNPFRSEICFNIDKLDKKKDIVVDFARTFDCSKGNSKEISRNFEGILLVFFTHYFLKAKEISNCLKRINNYVVVAENNLIENSYFRKIFPFVDKVYQLPFVYNSKRFFLKNDFSTRVNKCLAVGAICPVGSKEFQSFFGEEYLHPMRRYIYEKSSKYNSEIDSFIRPFDHNVDKIRIIKKNDSFFEKLLKKNAPDFLVKILLGGKSRKEYYKFDIVQKYNEYKMFVCPEELVGLPSINAFEGMACGSVFIGIDDPMYTNLGMIPGVHYIAYESGNFRDLVDKIRYYQDRPGILEEISKSGREFAENNLSEENIANSFWDDIEKISNRFCLQNKIDVVCAFNKDNKK